MLSKCIDLPEGPFSVVYADPPWRWRPFSDRTGLKKSPQSHYDCMELDDIKAMQIPAAKDSFLLMWATFPMLPQALEVMKVWGFTYKTGGSWAKRSKRDRAWAFGTGYIFRSASELLLVGTKGSPKWLSKSERNLWVAPLREHSRKPDMVHDMIERSTSGPRLELFARQEREGWTVWGNDVEKFNV